jgi:hypothetical protein
MIEGLGENRYTTWCEHPAHFLHRLGYIEMVHNSAARNDVDMLSGQLHCLGVLYQEFDIGESASAGVLVGLMDGDIRDVDPDDVTGFPGQVESKAASSAAVFEQPMILRRLAYSLAIKIEPIADGRIEAPNTPVPLGIIRKAVVVILALPFDALCLIIHMFDSLWRRGDCGHGRAR